MGNKPRPIFIELCCGSAGLTAACARLGFRAFGVDWKRNKSKKPKHHILNLDLTVPANQRFIKELIASGRVGGIHMGPPCGTASRARDRPLRGKARKAGIRRPMPLRSAKFPLGLPNIKGVAKERVRMANILYKFCSEVAVLASKHLVPWTMENPENSYFWDIGFIKFLLTLPNVRDVLYDACAHGGKRRKKQRVRASFDEADSLAATCDGLHKHLPWTFELGSGFSTAEEAEYPELFCNRLADKFADAAKLRGWSVCPLAKASRVRQAQAAISAHRQPKRSRTGQLVSEFERVIKVSNSCKVEPGSRCSTELNISGVCVPKGSKRLKTSNGVSSPTDDVPAFFGVYRDPIKFLQAARSVVHPALRAPVLDADVASVIAHNLRVSPAELVRLREAALAKYTAIRDDLANAEEELHKSMNPAVAKVMVGKNILLMRKMLIDLGYPASEFVSNLVSGFPITGDFPNTGLFPEQDKPAPFDREELWRTAKLAQEMVRSSVRSSGDMELDAGVWGATLDEVDKHWAEGPFTADEITARVGPLWVPSRRFGLKQPDKVRLIDDYSEFQVNATVSLSEKLELGGVDEIVMLARAMQEAKAGDLKTLSTWQGASIPVEVHSGWRDATLQGRTLDLAAAYRQLASRPSHESMSVLAVFSPVHKSCRFFILRALAFGSSASVMSFNWAAVLIKKIVVKLFFLVVTSYFDDYPSLEFDATAQSGQRTFEEVLKLLGWTFSDSEKKRKPFNANFRALGTSLDLTLANLRKIVVGNTPERISDIVGEIQGIISRRSLTAPQASSLRGKFNFAYGNFRGRPLAPALRQLSNRAEQHAGSAHVNERLMLALGELRDFLLEERPREVNFGKDQETAILFSDGAFEDGAASAGAVFLSSQSSNPEFWGIEIDKSLVKSWNNQGSNHAIAQAELFPIAVGLETWAEQIRNKYLLIFVDNNAVLDAMIKGNTGCFASLELLSHTCMKLMRLGCVVWITRVPSSSNIADGPSRFDWKTVESIPGGSKVEPCIPADFCMTPVQ